MKPPVLRFVGSQGSLLNFSWAPAFTGPFFFFFCSEKGGRARAKTLLLFVMVTDLGLNGEFTAFLKLTHFHPKPLGWGWNSAKAFQGTVPVSWPWMILSGPAQGCSSSWEPQSSLFCSKLIFKHDSAI